MPKKYEGIPSYQQFRRDTGFRGVKSNRVASAGNDDRMLAILDRLLRLYDLPDTQNDIKRAQRILVEIYFVTNAWLERHERHGDVKKSRAPHVNALFLAAVDQLCAVFRCPVNILPFHLEKEFGRQVDETMYEKKQYGATEYIDRSEESSGAVYFPNLGKGFVAILRIEFRNGLAYMWDWYSQRRKFHLVKSNSLKAGNPLVITPGFAGYALRMDRTLYMARQREGGEGKTKIAHSAYTGGQAVLCAGEIAIVKGKIVCVTTASGHYKPTPEKLLHVLNFLAMHGVNMSELAVGTESRQGSKYYQALPFLGSGGDVNQLTPLSKQEVRKMFLQRIPGWVQGMQTRMEHIFGHALSQEEILGQFF